MKTMQKLVHMCTKLPKNILEERLRWVLPIVNKQIKIVGAAKVFPGGKRTLERWVANYKDKKIICPCQYYLKEVEENGYCHCRLFIRWLVLYIYTIIVLKRKSGRFSPACYFLKQARQGRALLAYSPLLSSKRRKTSALPSGKA